MTYMHEHVPEPERQKKEDANASDLEAQIPASSSDDDSGDEFELNMEGYQPLTLSENEVGISEFHPQPHDSSDDEMVNDSDTQEQRKEMADETKDSGTQGQRREMAVNPDLVLSAMKDISLPGSSIPPWAKDISDSEWNNIIKRTMTGQKVTDDTRTANSNGASSPSS